VLTVMVLLFNTLSCRQPPEVAGGGEQEAFHKHYSQGKAALDYELSQTAMRVADLLALSLTVSAPEDYAVHFQEIPDELGKFRVADHHEEQPVLQPDGLMRHSQHLTLEPGLAGQYVIPTLTVTVGSRGGGQPEIMRTDEVQVKVESLLPSGEKNIDISDIAPPLAPPHQWLLIILAFVLGIALLGSAVWFLARQRGKTAAASIPCHERALSDLAELLAADLPAKGEVKQFYAQVSDILRRYIEERFGLRAPERTTEEFLAELGTSDALIGKHQNLLGRFLSHCDQVKFAGYLPTTSEIEKTSGLCREFILETAPASIREKQ